MNDKQIRQIIAAMIEEYHAKKEQAVNLMIDATSMPDTSDIQGCIGGVIRHSAMEEAMQQLSIRLDKVK